MSILTTIEAEGRAALTWIDHAAAWLVGTVATAETNLHALEASSPIVAEALAAGEAAATARGIPVTAIESAGETVLTEAKKLAAELAPAAPAAPAASPRPV